MKKSFTLIVICLLLGAELKAQKQVMFKMKVSPNKDYAISMKMDMNMIMDVTGDTAVVNKMKKAGQNFPMVMDMGMNMTGDMITKAADANNKFPFSMAMKVLPVKMTMNGKETPIPMPATNETMYGTYSADGKMIMDSVAGKKIDEATKAAMVKMMDGLQATIKFPEAPMKIGDTFTQDYPLNLPMGTMGGKMDAKITYKLTAIDASKAYFDLKYDMNMAMAGMGVNMTATGDGKLIYDIPSSYPTSMHSNININYTMNMPQATGTTMSGKMKMAMDSQTIITAK